MKNTIELGMAATDVREGQERDWINNEGKPLVDAVRRVLNDEYRESAQLTTAGTGTATTIWTSDPIPTNSTWVVEVRVMGVQSNGANRCGYIRRGVFYNNAGTVGQQGSTASSLAESSAAGTACTLSVSGQTVICQVTDDGANTYNWFAAIQVTRTRQA